MALPTAAISIHPREAGCRALRVRRCVVCCYKGMTASGGAEGVGRAVNQAVVTTFLAIGAFNCVFTQTLLATHPEILMIK